jgi:hypothetical protein
MEREERRRQTLMKRDASVERLVAGDFTF